MSDYQSFVARKLSTVTPTGIRRDVPLPQSLFPHQASLTRWALKRGRSAIFADTGLGKSRMEVAWAEAVRLHTGMPVLMLAPLAVAAQTAQEAAQIGIEVAVCREASDVNDRGINITNYDRLHKFNPAMFGGVVLDESSIIKHHDARTFQTLTAAFRDTPFKLPATATLLRRVMMPGRDVSFHCMLMPAGKERDGYIGLKDFRGDLIRAFQRHGFIYHSEVTIWKDPVTAMQRTKALGLLHKSVRENAAMCRQGIPDYLVTMRTPGEQAQRVIHYRDDDELWEKCKAPTALDRSQVYPVDEWQKVASPVWMDINPNDTLQYRSAREHDDERHICPLQLEVIRRGVRLWTNPGDVVLSPFMGIGSEGFVSLELGRKFVGVELKESYYRQAVANLEAATKEAAQDLFAEA